MKLDKALLTLCAIGLHHAAPLQAYETDTHALTTFHSFDRSVLAQPDIWQRLGLDRFEDNQPFHFPDAVPYTPARDAYFDYQPNVWQQQAIGETFRRKIDAYELKQFPLPFRDEEDMQLELKAWLMRGAVREDDLLNSDYEEEPEDRPDIDPHGELTRVFHHFYDPINDRELNLPVSCSLLPGSIPGGCVRSTDWAMGVVDAAGATPSGPDPARRNHFSYADARAAEWCALTYGGGNPAGTVTEAGARRACWATTFRSVGDVLHLLQDTGQPQHVRNDRHNPPNGSWWKDKFATSQSRRTYEVWTNYRATLGEISSPETEVDAFTAFFATQASVPPIQTGNYPKPMFSRAIEFFTTRASDADFRDRRGLADFTNRNVYSEGTIFSNDYNSPPSNPSDPGLTFIERPSGVSNLLGALTVGDILWDGGNDSVQPGFVDPPLQAFGGKIPLARRSIWFGVLGGAEDDIITLDQYTTHADVLIPRAISYGAGLIDYFFRGKLEVNSVAVPQGVVGVVDQGVMHTVEIGGHPRDANGLIFGFKKIRLQLSNSTAPITEAGTGTVVPQTVGAGQLLAVARYHLNSCYRPSLSGQRVQHFAPPPEVLIDEPACADGGVQRTDFQEISVSAPLTISGPADLPGGDGGSATVDQVFDFTDQPIPINATDLFIQVVYRGVLGEEPDGIAVGTLDVREPSYVATYNGSDFRWNGSAWVPGVVGTSGTTRGVDFLHVCAGSPSKLIYRRAEFGQTALIFPSTGAVPIPPGVVRLGILFTEPASPTSQRVLRHQPTMEPPPSAAPRISTTRGNRRQANKETVAQSVLDAPIYCAVNGVPTSGDYWCNDPIQQRRGQRFGDIAQPIYYSPVGGGDANIDVDAVPLPEFSGLRMQELGENRFDQDAVLVACPTQPARTPEEAALMQQLIELEEAAAVGADPMQP